MEILAFKDLLHVFRRKKQSKQVLFLVVISTLGEEDALDENVKAAFPGP